MAVCRVTFTGSLYSSIFQNVWHFKKSDYVSSELPVLLTNLRDHWLDVYRNCFVAETVLISLHGEILQTGGGGDVSTLTLSLTGGGGSDRRVPLMMAYVIQLRTGSGGRRNRGRIFVPCQTVNGILDGVITGTKATEIQGYFTTIASRWCSPGSDYNWDLVLHGPTDDPDEGRLVTTMQLRALPGCQRRRELGVGI